MASARPGSLEVGEHHHGLRLHRAPEVDGLVRPGERRHRWNGLVDRHRRDTVEHHAHRSLVAVLPDEHHGPAEVGVVEPRPGDEEVPAERAHRGILARPGRDPGGRGAGLTP